MQPTKRHPDDLLPHRRDRFRTLAAVCVLVFVPSAGTNLVVRGPHQVHRSVPGVRDELVDVLQHHYYKSIDERTLSHVTEKNVSTVLNDAYTTVFTAAQLSAWDRGDDGAYGGIGVHAFRNEANDIVIDDVTKNGPAARARIQVGDVITQVAGVPAANHKVLEVLQRLRGAPGTAVTLRTTRNSQLRELTLIRTSVVADIVTSEIREDGSSTVGYISVLEFSTSSAAQIRDEVQKLRDHHVDLMLLDLRHNPGGLVTEALHSAEIFLPKSSRVFSESGAHVDIKSWSTHEAPIDAATPLAVLVDNETASASELLAAALRDNGRAVVVGSRTFGKGVIQEVFELSEGGAVKVTTAEYRTPSGTRINHVGIEPDVEARPEAHEHIDSVAAKAIEVLRRMAGRPWPLL